MRETVTSIRPINAVASVHPTAGDSVICAPARSAGRSRVDGYFKIAPPLFPRALRRSAPTEGIFSFNTHDASTVLRAWEQVLDFLHRGRGFWKISVYNAPRQIHGPWWGLPVVGGHA